MFHNLFFHFSIVYNELFDTDRKIVFSPTTNEEQT